MSNKDRWVWTFGSDPIQMCGYWDNTLTRDQCGELIQMAEDIGMESGEVGDETLESSIRNAQIARLPVNPDTRWIYEKAGHILEDINRRYFGFELTGFLEPLQITKYGEGDFHKKHIDTFYGGIVRKVTIVIQLSAPEDYDGGELNLHFAEEPYSISKDLGYAAIFPSYTLHDISEVTRGARYSLVGWASGKPYK